MLFLKQVADHMRLLLSAVEMTTHTGHHLRLVGRSALAQGIGLDVLIEQLVRVQLRAVARQPDQTQAFGICGDKRPRGCRPMHRVSIDDQADPARDLPEHAPHELDKHRIAELALEHHERQAPRLVIVKIMLQPKRCPVARTTGVCPTGA